MTAIATSAWMPAPREAPRRLFAIGDVHGQSDLLRALHTHLESLLNAASPAGPPVTEPVDGPVLVHLGDYIDRGPDSLGALRAALDWSHPRCEAVALPGNHEQIMLRFADTYQEGAKPERQEDALALWVMNGGSEVCAELGILDITDPAVVGVALTTRLTPLLERLRALPAAAFFPPYLFVHAGLPRGVASRYVPPADVPGIDWRAERPGSTGFRGSRSPLWVREGFLDVVAPWPDDAIVIHGHTIVRHGPDIRPNRIGLDLGAFKHGRLAMIELSGARMRFHLAQRSG